MPESRRDYVQGYKMDVEQKVEKCTWLPPGKRDYLECESHCTSAVCVSGGGAGVGLTRYPGGPLLAGCFGGGKCPKQRQAAPGEL